MSFLRFAILAFALLLASSLFADYPEKPIRLIVPTNAGGETDSTARIFERAFYDLQLLPVKVVVVNKPGAGGTIGTREVLEAEPDGYTICMWHPGIVTSKAMGVVDYDHSDFEIIGTTGRAETALGYKEGGRVQTAAQAIAFARENPNELTVSTNMGLPVHFVPLIFANELGIDLKFVQSGGGAKRLASMMGGHSDLAFFAIMAFKDGAASGLRPLVVFSEERSLEFPGVPTAKEFGVDLVVEESKIWLAPKGTPNEALEILRGALRAALADPGVSSKFRNLGVEPVFGEPEALGKSLNLMKARVEPLVAEALKLDPLHAMALPRICSVILGLLLLGVAVRSVARRRATGRAVKKELAYELEPTLAVFVVAFSATYTLILSFNWLSFQWATLLFVFALGSAIGKWELRVMATSLAVAFVAGFGGQFLFTEVFTVDLPR